MTKINKSELMTNAWSLRKEYNMNMSEALKSAWSFMKMDIEETSISNNLMIDTIGSGTEFTVYVPFLKENIKYVVIDNKKHSKMDSTQIIDNDNFICEMVEYGGPHATFTRKQILKAVA